MITCCDFCETQEQGDAHMARLRAQYGKTKDGHPITPPKGWVIVPFGELIPQHHAEALEHGSWCYERRCHSTMTPLTARPWGLVRAYATPAQP